MKKISNIIKDIPGSVIIFVVVLIAAFLFVGFIGSDIKSEELIIQPEKDYILNYGIDEIHHIGFSAIKAELYSGGNVRYILEDNSIIYAQNGMITWKHENGAIDYYTNAYITSH